MRTNIGMAREALRAALKSRGVTQVEVAALLDLDQGPVSRRFAGITSWRLDEIEALADYLGTTVAALVQPDTAVD